MPEAQLAQIYFAGNSPRCTKTDAAEGHDSYRSLLLPNLGSVCPPSLRDRHVCHLGLLPFVTRVEYSCKTLHKWVDMVSENIP